MTLLGVGVAVGQQKMEHHLADLFSDEGEGPFEDVHEVWKSVRVLDFGILLEGELLLLNDEAITLILRHAPLLL